MQELRGSRCQKQQKKRSAGWRDQSGLLGLCQGASRRPLSTTFEEKVPDGNTHLIKFDGDHTCFHLRAKSNRNRMQAPDDFGALLSRGSCHKNRLRSSTL
jgi:hypothetical protein